MWCGVTRCCVVFEGKVRGGEERWGREEERCDEGHQIK